MTVLCPDALSCAFEQDPKDVALLQTVMRQHHSMLSGIPDAQDPRERTDAGLLLKTQNKSCRSTCLLALLRHGLTCHCHNQAVAFAITGPYDNDWFVPTTPVCSDVSQKHAELHQRKGMREDGLRKTRHP